MLYFHDYRIFHHWHAIIHSTTSLLWDTCFAIIISTKMNTCASFKKIFLECIYRSGIVTDKMNIFMKDCFSKGKPFYTATNNVLLYQCHGVWPALGVIIQNFLGKWNHCQMLWSFSLYSFDHYRTWFYSTTWCLFSFYGDHFSLGLSVVFVFYMYVLFIGF